MLPNKLKEIVKYIKYHMVKAKADSEALLDLYRFLHEIILYDILIMKID